MRIKIVNGPARRDFEYTVDDRNLKPKAVMFRLEKKVKFPLFTEDQEFERIKIIVESIIRIDEYNWNFQGCDCEPTDDRKYRMVSGSYSTLTETGVIEFGEDPKPVAFFGTV